MSCMLLKYAGVLPVSSTRLVITSDLASLPVQALSWHMAHHSTELTHHAATCAAHEAQQSGSCRSALWADQLNHTLPYQPHY